jgi:hypothetical protein
MLPLSYRIIMGLRECIVWAAAAKVFLAKRR